MYTNVCENSRTVHLRYFFKYNIVTSISFYIYIYLLYSPLYFDNFRYMSISFQINQRKRLREVIAIFIGRLHSQVSEICLGWDCKD